MRDSVWPVRLSVIGEVSFLYSLHRHHHHHCHHKDYHHQGEAYNQTLVIFDSQVALLGPEGEELDAEGLSFQSPLDMRYTQSSVCLNVSIFGVVSGIFL